MAKRTRDGKDVQKTDGAVDGQAPDGALPPQAALALEKLRRVDAQLAARYEQTRVERRKRAR